MKYTVFERKNDHMTDYLFVCIGTNKIISDSFGPRVGEKLKVKLYQYPTIQIFGTMENPIHFQNAKTFLEQLNLKKQEKIIIIDSALGKEKNIGNSYVNLGGIELGKAFGKSFYFPAYMNIKTVIGNENNFLQWNVQQIDLLAEKVANRITQVVNMVTNTKI